MVIRGAFHRPPGAGKAPLVIMMHGLTSTRYENHFMFVDLSRQFEAQGIASLRFDFMGSGESDGSFSDMTVFTELDDANAIFDFAMRLPNIDPDRIFLLGMSLGGAVAGMTAARRRDEVRALILWAPGAVIPDACRAGRILDATFDPDHLPEVIDLLGLPLGSAFITTGLTLDIFNETEAYDRPTLILHGDADDIVPISYSETYQRKLKNCKLIPVENAGHSLDSIDVRERFLNETIRFVCDNLNLNASGSDSLMGNDSRS
jgi:pimeloyl-ACP methyl ester carboxylesterase